MTQEEVLRYLRLTDRRSKIVMSSGINWKPEYEQELEGIERELKPLRLLVDTELTDRRIRAAE